MGRRLAEATKARRTRRTRGEMTLWFLLALVEAAGFFFASVFFAGVLLAGAFWEGERLVEGLVAAGVSVEWDD
jgi:hypothetical protein